MGVFPECVFEDGQVPGAAVLDLPDCLPVLDRGAHHPGSGKACAMEAASWLAGEKWSDQPRSVNGAIASIARWVNDAVDDSERQGLWPLVIASLDTASVARSVDRKLRSMTREAGCRAVTTGRPREAWVQLLVQHFRLTGHSSASVPGKRVEELSAYLRSLGGTGRNAVSGPRHSL